MPIKTAKPRPAREARFPLETARAMTSRLGFVLSPLILSGCAVPTAVSIATLTADAFSLVVSEKTLADHAISQIAQKDCALWRGFTGEEVCVDEDGTVAVAAVTDAALAGIEFRVTQAPEGDIYELGKTHLQNGRVGLALEMLEWALLKEPNSVRVLNAMAIAYDQLGRFELSGRYFGQALSLAPDSVQTLNNIGYSYLAQGKPNLAQRYLVQAHELADTNPAVKAIVKANLDRAADIEVAGAETTERRSSEVLAKRDAETTAPRPPQKPVWIERSAYNLQTLVTRPDAELLRKAEAIGVDPRIASTSVISEPRSPAATSEGHVNAEEITAPPATNGVEGNMLELTAEQPATTGETSGSEPLIEENAFLVAVPVKKVTAMPLPDVTVASKTDLEPAADAPPPLATAGEAETPEEAGEGPGMDFEAFTVQGPSADKPVVQAPPPEMMDGDVEMAAVAEPSGDAPAADAPPPLATAGKAETREVVAETPEQIAEAPEAVAETPGEAEPPEEAAATPAQAETPEQIAEAPEAVTETPEEAAEAPEQAETPEQIAEAPEAVAEVPEAVAATPEQAETLEEAVEAPEMNFEPFTVRGPSVEEAAEAPEEVAEAPEQVAETPEAKIGERTALEAFKQAAIEAFTVRAPVVLEAFKRAVVDSFTVRVPAALAAFKQAAVEVLTVQAPAALKALGQAVAEALTVRPPAAEQALGGVVVHLSLPEKKHSNREDRNTVGPEGTNDEAFAPETNGRVSFAPLAAGEPAKVIERGSREKAAQGMAAQEVDTQKAVATDAGTQNGVTQEVIARASVTKNVAALKTAATHAPVQSPVMRKFKAYRELVTVGALKMTGMGDAAADKVPETVSATRVALLRAPSKIMIETTTVLTGTSPWGIEQSALRDTGVGDATVSDGTDRFNLVKQMHKHFASLGFPISTYKDMSTIRLALVRIQLFEMGIVVDATTGAIYFRKDRKDEARKLAQLLPMKTTLISSESMNGDVRLLVGHTLMDFDRI